MATVEELRQWCEESRKILRTSGKVYGSSKKSQELEKHLNQVVKQLNELAGDRASIKAYKECLAEFERLQKRMQVLASSVDESSKKDKEAKNNAQAELNQAFGQLETKLQKAVTTMKEARVQQQKLREKRAEYEQEYTKALQAVERLKITPKGNAVNVERELQQIQDQASQNNVDAYQIGIESLKKLMPKVQEAQKTAERLRQDELKQWEARPAAQKRLEDVQLTLLELEKLPGIESVLKQYREVVQAARVLAEGGAWIQVGTKLDELSKLKKLEAYQEESRKQVAKLSELPRYQEGQGYVDKLKELLTAEEAAEFQRGFHAVANVLLTQGVKSEQQRVLSDAVDNLKSEAQLAANLHSALEGLSRELTNAMGELRELAPSLAVLGEQNQFEAFAALFTSKRLKAAWTAGEELQQRLEALLPEKRRDRETWAKKRGFAANVEKQLTALLNSPCEAVKRRVPSALYYVAANVVGPLEQAHDWSRLVGDLEKGRAQLRELSAMDREFRALDEARTEASRDIDEKAQALQPLMTALANAVVKANKAAGKEPFDVTESYRQRVTVVKSQWEQAKKNLSDAKALEAAHQQALRLFAAMALELTEGVKPEKLGGVIEDHEQQQAMEEFESQWPELEEALERVQALDNETAQGLRKRARELRNVAPVNAKDALKALATLKQDADAGLRQIGNTQKVQQQQIAQLALEVKTEIERVRKATSNRKLFEEAFKALEIERAELALLGTSTNLDALEEASKGLTALKLRASRFAPDEGGSGLSIDKVFETLESTEKLLENLRKTLEQNNPGALVRLTQRLLLLKTEVYAAEPEEGMTKLANFTKALTEAENGAKKVVEIRDAYTKLLERTEPVLENFAKRKVAPEYAKQLQGRLGEAKKLAAKPEKLFEAYTSLQTIDQELNAASRDLQAAMAKEKGVLDQRHQDEVTAKSYERSLKLCEGQYVKEARAAVAAASGDKALLLELERMLGVARQSAKQGDMAKALHEVELTIGRAKQITADPYGPAIGSRNNLPKDNQVYREALSAFHETLDLVGRKTLELAGTVNGGVKNRLGDMLEGLKAKFDANAFEAPLAALTREGASDGDRRAARETALAKVRQVQGLLAGNPQVQLLLQNPAAKSEFSVGYRRLQSALTRLDANISRSVR